MPKPHRVQLRRVKGWRMPPNTLSVARPSRWGNPFRIGELVDVAFRMQPMVLTPEAAVDLYRFWLLHSTEGQALWTNHCSELYQRNLACWCPLSQPCHSDVLLELMNP